MDMVCIFVKMVMNLLVIGKMTKLMVKVFIKWAMETFIMVIGKMEDDMVMVHRLNKIKKDMKVNG